jgi:hypothetical protein
LRVLTTAVGGQGIASGFRDAISLSWRLKLAISPSYPNYKDLFRGWYVERKQQLERSLAATIQNGNYCNESSKVKAFLRNWYLWLIQLVPSWRYDLELGPRKAGLTRYDHTLEAPFLPDFGGGISLPQVFAAPIDQPAPPVPMFTDDAIFSNQKRCIFQVVALATSLEELRSCQSEINSLGTRYNKDDLVSLAETTYIVHKQAHQTLQATSRLAPPPESRNIVRVVGAEEYKATGETEGAIARGFPRPEPLYYEPNRIYKDLGAHVVFAVIRWDRIVFARCRNLFELEVALTGIEEALKEK